jgi:hypothetical protein
MRDALPARKVWRIGFTPVSPQKVYFRAFVSKKAGFCVFLPVAHGSVGKQLSQVTNTSIHGKSLRCFRW